jgi:hypothetical protein
MGGLSLSDPVVWRRIAEAMRRALEELATGADPTPPMEDTDASTDL